MSAGAFKVDDVVKVNRLKDKLTVKLVIEPGRKYGATILRQKLEVGMKSTNKIAELAKLTLKTSNVFRYIVKSVRGNYFLVHEGVMSLVESDFKIRSIKSLAEVMVDFPTAMITDDGELDCDSWNYVVNSDMLKNLGKEVLLNGDNEDTDGNSYPEEILKPLPRIINMVMHYPLLLVGGPLVSYSRKLYSSLEHIREVLDNDDEWEYGKDAFWLGDERYFGPNIMERFAQPVPDFALEQDEDDEDDEDDNSVDLETNERNYPRLKSVVKKRSY